MVSDPARIKGQAWTLDPGKASSLGDLVGRGGICGFEFAFRDLEFSLHSSPITFNGVNCAYVLDSLSSRGSMFKLSEYL